MELREVNVAVTVLVLFAVGRGICAEDALCKLSCQRNVLSDLFDDLQDSINARNDDELQMFYRHFCGNELAESTRWCYPGNDDEKALLHLASTTARLFNCTENDKEVSLKQQRGQHLASWRAPGACNYRRAINCVTDFIATYTSKVAMAAKRKEELKQAHADVICQRRQGTCTANHSVVDCTANQRATVARFEGGLSRSIAQLCLDDAALLKNLSKTLHCWDLLKLNACFNPSGLLTAPALFSARHTHKQCRDIEVKMIRCLDGTLGGACGERPDLQGTRNLVSALLSTADCSVAAARSSSAGGRVAAFLTLPVAVAAALALRLPF
ncbi:uncharacterized protein LOC144124489 isoform X2 [Amblyomma americanum]